MSKSLTFFVEGRPVPQGSKHAWYNQRIGRVMMKESSGQPHASWRASVTNSARLAMADAGHSGPSTLPISIRLFFNLYRPRFHYGSGRNEQTVKASASPYPTTQPDIDKLVRSILDSLTAAVYFDDSQVVSLGTMKLWADRYSLKDREGVLIVVRFLDGPPAKQAVPGLWT